MRREAPLMLHNALDIHRFTTVLLPLTKTERMR